MSYTTAEVIESLESTVSDLTDTVERQQKIIEVLAKKAGVNISAIEADE